MYKEAKDRTTAKMFLNYEKTRTCTAANCVDLKISRRIYNKKVRKSSSHNKHSRFICTVIYNGRFLFYFLHIFKVMRFFIRFKLPFVDRYLLKNK